MIKSEHSRLCRVRWLQYTIYSKHICSILKLLLDRLTFFSFIENKLPVPKWWKVFTSSHFIFGASWINFYHTFCLLRLHKFLSFTVVYCLKCTMIFVKITDLSMSITDRSICTSFKDGCHGTRSVEFNLSLSLFSIVLCQSFKQFCKRRVFEF